jgi:hypothetical protein
MEIVFLIERIAMYRHIVAAFVIAFSAMVSAPAKADDALYGAAVPEDAVFLRQFGNPDGTRVFGRSFRADELPDETFVAISASALSGAVPGTFYSVVGQASNAPLIAEPGREKNGKVHLVLVNASGAPARLLIQDNGAEVIAWTNPGEAASRAVNPVTVTLAVEGQTGTTPVEAKLRRGQNVSILVTDGSARIVPDAFGPVID